MNLGGLILELEGLAPFTWVWIMVRVGSSPVCARVMLGVRAKPAVVVRENVCCNVVSEVRVGLASGFRVELGQCT